MSMGSEISLIKSLICKILLSILEIYTCRLYDSYLILKSVKLINSNLTSAITKNYTPDTINSIFINILLDIKRRCINHQYKLFCFQLLKSCQKISNLISWQLLLGFYLLLLTTDQFFAGASSQVHTLFSSTFTM